MIGDVQMYPHEPLEWCDHDGAEALKRKIAAAWDGHKITFTTVRVAFAQTMRAARWDVRSDMINGLPRELYERQLRKARGQ